MIVNCICCGFADTIINDVGLSACSMFDSRCAPLPTLVVDQFDGGGVVSDSSWDEIAKKAYAAREARRQLLTGKEAFVEELAAILFQHDPVGLNFETNTDEYMSEAETITLRLAAGISEHDAARVVHEEFVRWFGGIAGPLGRYETVADDVWRAWVEFSSGSTS